VTDVRRGIGVIDRSGNVKCFVHILVI
jgi:hypothetical protein